MFPDVQVPSEIVNVTFPVVGVKSLPTHQCWVPHL